ncbi:ParB N-terminal domain-containing protein [Mesorhizobium sp. J428]|uniref:ParB/RepB/Spo0J family partition protein n=1 Tax=Mesorhizobium sp. J428 TaxID=2898440 RepID=UPI002151950B|nr:ParB N-terminal domain-containing protein [Mesorhizobium sp. J428]MCR5855955.1 ParB N-terminal domain-containing protein [Mesorhizobium sp. J428]
MPVPSNPDAIVDIAIDLIDVPAGRRKLDPKWVETLAGLFASQGQLSPIEVIARSDRFQLVFGAHRLAAGSKAGWSTIRAAVKDAATFASEAEIKLREITENLARREPSVLDRSVDIATWREIYNAAHAISKGGRKPKDADQQELTAKFAVSFTRAAQIAFQLSERSIFLAVKIASIPADLRDAIALYPIAENQSELLQLASEPVGRQQLIVGVLTRTARPAASVSDAIAEIDRAPKPRPSAAWEKLSGVFSRMKEKDQNRFFDLHEGAIRRWLAERGG